MNSSAIQVKSNMSELSCSVSEITVAQLVGDVFEAAPVAERGRLLEYLLKPLGVLSLVAVAHGVFAKIRFRAGWPDLQVRLEDAQSVQVSDVITLAEHVQQVSVETIDGMARILTTSPGLLGSAAAILLVTMLLKQSQKRRNSDPVAGV